MVLVITGDTQRRLAQTTPVNTLPTYPSTPTIPTVFTLKGSELTPFIFVGGLF